MRKNVQNQHIVHQAEDGADKDKNIIEKIDSIWQRNTGARCGEHWDDKYLTVEAALG